MTRHNSGFLGLFAALALAACGSVPDQPAPEPKVVVREVKVPVAVPCIKADADLTAPKVPDTDAALRAAASGADRLLLLAAGRLIREAWILGAVETLKVCQAPATDVPH